ncbi:hypothetical protein LCGC14_0395480 [marine sediment metagenome]|uniref:Uncharacterized protein n=1 Tax=marine sediment metagenome TaxID=412755 RepID=A0A0F9TGE9_9ZZZZ
MNIQCSRRDLILALFIIIFISLILAGLIVGFMLLVGIV